MIVPLRAMALIDESDFYFTAGRGLRSSMTSLRFCLHARLNQGKVGSDLLSVRLDVDVDDRIARDTENLVPI